MCKGKSVNCSCVIFPLWISFTMNSSYNKQLAASLRASSRVFSLTKSGYSSRKANIHEGSIPIKGVSSEIISLSKTIFFSAMPLAFFKKPLDNSVRPLSTCLGIITSYPKVRSSFMNFMPISTSM